MLKIGICDDNQAYRRAIHRLCDDFSKEKKIESEITEYESAEEAIQLNNNSDLLFLDVEMSGMSGIEYKNYLWDRRAATKIIFVTSHEENMAEGFGDNVQGYLLKPIEASKARQALERFYNRWKDNTVIITNGAIVKNIAISNILYIQADGNYVSFVTSNEVVLANNGISYWEEKLREYPFYRAQRSFLLNIEHIKKTGKTIIMSNNDEISCSREKIAEVKEVRMNYLLNESRRFNR